MRYTVAGPICWNMYGPWKKWIQVSEFGAPNKRHTISLLHIHTQLWFMHRFHELWTLHIKYPVQNVGQAFFLKFKHMKFSPWQASDFSPLLNAKLPGSVTTPQSCKSLIWHTGCACYKLQEAEPALIIITFHSQPEPLDDLVLIVIAWNEAHKAKPVN